MGQNREKISKQILFSFAGGGAPREPIFFYFRLKKYRGVLANDFSCKSCLIAVLTVFSWTFNSLACFLIDVVMFFLIAIMRAVKKPSFRF